jgi:hypothetical protein
VGAWMFVFCVLYSKERRQRMDKQNKEVQIKHKERAKESAVAVDMCVVCVYSTKKETRTKR